MKQSYSVVLLVASLFVFACSAKKPATPAMPANDTVLYSSAIKDSFYISVQLPEAYLTEPDKRFPVVYTLDGNFHFPMLAAMMAQYEKGGLLPPLILVGIGYGSFQLMDSLRVRDYLYPEALPSDELTTAAGANQFDDFIKQQLIAYIDQRYRTDTTQRTLSGHSFGGYFTLHSLSNQVKNQQYFFKNFIAASPSLWYHNFLLNGLPGEIKNADIKDQCQVFLSVGGEEDSTWNLKPLQQFGQTLTSVPGIKTNYKVYNNLGHMDVATLTFIKGLQEFYPME
ncbi:MAG: alpha/beta hydrolase [Agriterribacter sp.]